MERTSDRPLALSAAPGPRHPDRPKAERFSREALQGWMQYMEDYGQSWLEDTGRDFYSQEYWYLVTMALVRHWQGAPLNVSDACQCMRTGSSKTRKNRLKKVMTEHWCIKVKDQTDLRRTYLEATEDMLLLGREHFRSSLGGAVRLLTGQGLIKRNPTPLLCDIEGSGRNLDKPYLLPWAEFLIGYTNDWNHTFQNRFRTDEYWLLFVRCLRGSWRNRPLTMGEACQCMSFGSSRTRERRIALAASRGMLKKQRGGQDLRVTSILASNALEDCLTGHFVRTLSGVATLIDRLLDRSNLR